MVARCARQKAAALPRRPRRGRGGCPPPPRTKWTRRVPHPVLIGHASPPPVLGGLPPDRDAPPSPQRAPAADANGANGFKRANGSKRGTEPGGSGGGAAAAPDAAAVPLPPPSPSPYASPYRTHARALAQATRLALELVLRFARHHARIDREAIREARAAHPAAWAGVPPPVLSGHAASLTPY